MTCAQAEDEIEAVAAGERPASDEFRRHVEACLGCSSALASARRVESRLTAWGAPPAPPRFTAAVAARIRRERWRSEQLVDRVFNALLIAGLLIVVAGIAALLNVAAVATAVSHGIEFLARAGERPASATPAPSLLTYVVGTAFFGTALAAWWWAERRL